MNNNSKSFVLIFLLMTLLGLGQLSAEPFGTVLKYTKNSNWDTNQHWVDLTAEIKNKNQSMTFVMEVEDVFNFNIEIGSSFEIIEEMGGDEILSSVFQIIFSDHQLYEAKGKSINLTRKDFEVTIAHVRLESDGRIFLKFNHYDEFYVPQYNLTHFDDDYFKPGMIFKIDQEEHLKGNFYQSEFLLTSLDGHQFLARSQFLDCPWVPTKEELANPVRVVDVRINDYYILTSEGPDEHYDVLILSNGDSFADLSSPYDFFRSHALIKVAPLTYVNLNTAKGMKLTEGQYGERFYYSGDLRIPKTW